MNTRWQPWLTPVPVIQDEIYDIPRAVMICWWNRIRPDLTLSDGEQKPKINPEGTLNFKAYRLGNTGYVQKIKLTPNLVDHGNVDIQQQRMVFREI